MWILKHVRRRVGQTDGVRARTQAATRMKQAATR